MPRRKARGHAPAGSLKRQDKPERLFKAWAGLRFDFEEAVQPAERLAHRALQESGFFAHLLPSNVSESDLRNAAAKTGIRSWTVFDDGFRPAPAKGSRGALALDFLQELRLARACVRDGNIDQAARISFLAALAFSLLLTDLAETRERQGSAKGAKARRKVDRAALDAALRKHRSLSPRRTPVNEAIAAELGVSIRTVQRHLKR